MHKISYSRKGPYVHNTQTCIKYHTHAKIHTFTIRRNAQNTIHTHKESYVHKHRHAHNTHPKIHILILRRHKRTHIWQKTQYYASQGHQLPVQRVLLLLSYQLPGNTVLVTSACGIMKYPDYDKIILVLKRTSHR